MDGKDRMRFANSQFYMKTEEEMREALRFPGRTIPRWRLLKCNVVLERDSILPRFPLPPGYTEETLFRKECEDGPEAPLWRTIPKDAWDRYMYERALLFSRASLHTPH